MALILIHQASLQIPDSHGSSPHTIIPTPSKGADQFLCSALFERKLRIATAYKLRLTHSPFPYFFINRA
ncbi:unnamed protein product [Arabidopsis lyrata]|nr:unnamed protein product [Arabidopsis lyrata]